MDKSTIYILAILIGGIIGLISMFFKKGTSQNNNSIKKKKEDISNNTEKENAFKNNRVEIIDNDIFIFNDISLRNKDIEIQPILKFLKEIPEIKIFEDGALIRTFIIESKNINPNLKEQYFHSSIRINSNSSVQIDGYISKSLNSFEKNDEGIRFQPFFLSDKEEINKSLKGNGMFQRGLHYEGIISSGNIRLICICDDCEKSFSLEFYHAGFSEVQYFYSSNSKETLLVPYYNELGKVPFQLQKEINEQELSEIESKLPKSKDGTFNYYNSFKCPHCGENYIDFVKNKQIRPNEYYVNYYLNQKTISL